MKRHFLILMFLLGNLTSKADIKVKGYYIKNNNDTIHSTFLFYTSLLSNKIDFYETQFKVKIINENDNKVYNLIPDSVLGFELLGEINVKFISLRNNFEEIQSQNDFSTYKPYIFVEVESDGFLKLYNLRYMAYIYSGGAGSGVPMTGGYSTPASVYYIQKAVGLFEEVEGKNSRFREQMSELLSDNPDLVYKIKNKEYKYRDIGIIIKEYNNWKKNGSIVPIDTNVYSVVDVSPKYNDRNIEDINDYFKDKIEWPKDENNTKIVIQAILELNGKLSNIQIRGFKNHPEINQKIIELASHMDKWQSGKVKEKKVRSMILMFINR